MALPSALGIHVSTHVLTFSPFNSPVATVHSPQHQFVRSKCLCIIVEGEETSNEDGDDDDKDDGDLKIAAKDDTTIHTTCTTNTSDDSAPTPAKGTSKRKSKRARKASVKASAGGSSRAKKAKTTASTSSSSSSGRVGLCCVFCANATDDIAKMQSFFPKSLARIVSTVRSMDG